MEQNVGGPDRVLRFILGTALVLGGGAGYVGVVRVAVGPLPQALTSALLVLVGTVLLVTASARRCPCLELLGIDTTDR
ncbi:MAG: DUF2892 domain-containing protein [Candidatus Nanohaloarchaea archaeon]|nr:DUF2892 domain-containing protein [Candidatus Nanohaloarchaea archaeon]